MPTARSDMVTTRRKGRILCVKAFAVCSWFWHCFFPYLVRLLATHFPSAAFLKTAGTLWRDQYPFPPALSSGALRPSGANSALCGQLGVLQRERLMLNCEASAVGA